MMTDEQIKEFGREIAATFMTYDIPDDVAFFWMMAKCAILARSVGISKGRAIAEFSKLYEDTKNV
jgi:hypothetical protein